MKTGKSILIISKNKIVPPDNNDWFLYINDDPEKNNIQVQDI
jgi:hypothetical protein